MNQYSRKSAGIALVATLAAGITALAATGQFRSHTANAGSIHELERAIATGHGDAATWAAYGRALQTQHEFSHAAQAYQRALDLHPAQETTATLRFNEALCLGQADEPDQFFAFFDHLTAINPKQAVDLLERSELASLHHDPRWQAAAANAHAQAAD